MKIKLLVLISILTFLLVGCKKSEDNYINNIRFYDTMEEVKSKISKPVSIETVDQLVYDDVLFEYDVKVMYVFSDNKLKDIFANFPAYDTDDKNQLRYTEVKNKLINKLGKENLVEIKDNYTVWNLNDGNDKYQVLLSMDDKNNTNILYSIK